MNTEIKFNGFSAIPSDYEAPDGDLAASINLINEDGALHPILPPEVVGHVPSGFIPMYIHTVSGSQKKYILSKATDNGPLGLYWKHPGSEISELLPSEKVLCVEAVGNTLVVATDSGIIYLLWKDNDYLVLGNRPPLATIDFGMRLAGTLNDSVTFEEVSKQCLPGGVNGASTASARAHASKDDLATLTQKIYAQLLLAVNDKVISEGLFYQPFFIRFAYRLFDGSYNWHSAPILMLPTATPPHIVLDNINLSNKTVDSRLDVPFFKLQYRILSEVTADLLKWKDIVSAIDVFVSAPIYTFDQSKDLQGIPYMSNYSFYAASPKVIKNERDNRPQRGSRGDDDPSTSINSDTEFLLGHYAANFIDDHFIDQTISAAKITAEYCWCIDWHEQFLEKITSVHDFYKIAELPLGDMTSTDNFTALPLTSSDFNNLLTRPTLPDDYRSHCRLLPSLLHSYNARINLAGLSIIPAEPFPLRMATEYTHTASPIKPTITVWTRINGTSCCVVHNPDPQTRADDFFNFESNFPRYLFYPDPEAYKMEIKLGNKKYTLSLKPHDYLNGAYYFNGLYPSPEPSTDTSTAPILTSPPIPILNKIYTSEINNPFYFPVLGINSVGAGEICGLSSAAKALSQGQFGQFPLYAFTSEGVWALEVSATGTFSARQPITRDVCINPDGITQLDSEVLFPTDRGVMLLSGSQAQCISDTINSDFPFDCLTLPQFDKLHAMLGSEHDADSCLPTLPLSEFIKHCMMIYDYVHQRILAYAPGVSYAYVFSLKSKMWGMTHSNLVSHLNSYPDALAITTDGNIVNFSNEDPAAPVKALYITRPLKLNSVNIYKTIDRIIQRGNFAKGHVRSVLYGSRDLINWHLVWSSKDHSLQGFRGTPYKFFRIGGIASLAPRESIYGASVEFSPRLTNQQR